MSAVYNSLANLRIGNCNCSVKVRILRKWKNTTKQANGFNLMLLDDKDYRIHGFVSNELGLKFAHLLQPGKVYTISNFSLKKYSDKDINLPIHREHQIFFCIYTTVKEEHDDGIAISKYAFDLYDLGDLEKLMHQDKYLTDVIGVMSNLEPLRDFVSNKGIPKRTVKFNLTDGRHKVHVTLWNETATDFNSKLSKNFERPLIVIIESAKVTSFKGTPELCTWFSVSRVHINHDFHAVSAMRKLLAQPFFQEFQRTSQTVITDKIFKLSELETLSEQYINKKIIVQISVKKVQTNSNWIKYECTSCQEEVTIEKEKMTCITCKRSLIHPDKKFRVAAICSDATNSVKVIFADRDVRRLTKTTASKVEDTKRSFPQVLKQLEKMDLTILLHIYEDNIKTRSNVYYAAEVFEGHNNNTPVDSYNVDQSLSGSNASTSSNQLEHLTNINLHSPTPTKPTAVRKHAGTPSFELFSQDGED